MKFLLLMTAAALLSFASFPTLAQPLPVELMVGSQYTTINTITTKRFSPASNLGYFHLHTLEVDNLSKNNNDLILQDLIYYEPIKHFRVTGGAFYELYSGFAPSLGVQYALNQKDLLILISPKVNLYKESQYDFFSVIQYKVALSEKTKLYSRAQLLNVFDRTSNIKSYQWMRLGVEIKGIQFGLAMNMDQNGPDPVNQVSWGGFIRKEIY